MRRFDLALPWPRVQASLGVFGVPGAESRLDAAMRRVHQSRCARALAIDLLAAQGCAVDAIEKAADGAPVWPAGFVGSLAHTEACAVAVTARRGDCMALGIDVEPALPLPADAGEIVLTPDERAWLASCDSRPHASRLVFCATECVHKALQPLRGAWLEFEEVAIEVDARLERFVPRPVSARARAAFDGVRAEGHIHLREAHIVATLALFAV